MGHERYKSADDALTDSPPDELARRLFGLGSVDGVHINSNVITVRLGAGQSTAGVTEIIADLFTYYRPGVEVVIPEG